MGVWSRDVAQHLELKASITEPSLFISPRNRNGRKLLISVANKSIDAWTQSITSVISVDIKACLKDKTCTCSNTDSN